MIAAVTGAVPEIVTGAEEVQVGWSNSKFWAHVRVTLPVKPRLGVIVIVDVPVPPGARVTGVLDSVKLGPAVTVIGMVTVTGAPVLVPLEAVPVTVTI